MKRFFRLLINPLGRAIISSALVLYVISISFVLILTFLPLPFFPDAFSEISRFIFENPFAHFLKIIFIAAFLIRITLLSVSKLENLAINSQQHPDLKFKGNPPLLSFMLPATEIAFFAFLAYYWNILASFDFHDAGTDYAQTLIEMLRSKKIALIWALGFIMPAFNIARGLPEALHSLGFSTDPEKTYIRYVWRTAAVLCVFTAMLSFYYCTETDLLFDIDEEPMVIIR